MEITELPVPQAHRGGYLLGLLAAVVGAAIGAAAWAVVAVVTEYELGIIAWALGGLAGYGMAWGYRNASRPAGVAAGVTAALVALLGILAARVAMAGYVWRDELASFHQQLAIVAMPSDRFERVHELAAHDANQRAKQERRSLFDELYRSVFFDSAVRYAALSDSDLAVAYDEFRQWRRAGCFADPEYIRLTLPHLWAWEAHLDFWYDREPVPDELWEVSYASAEERATALSGDEQTHTCRRLVQAWEVAGREHERRAMQQRLAPGDTEPRAQLLAEARAETLALDDATLSARFLETMDWRDDGQWRDTDWLRARLAYLIATQAWCALEEASLLDDPLPGPAWDECIAEAAQRAAETPEESLADSVRDERERLRQAIRGEADAARRIIYLGLVFAVASTLGWFDLIFGGLAVITAYRVATTARSSEQALPADREPWHPPET